MVRIVSADLLVSEGFGDCYGTWPVGDGSETSDDVQHHKRRRSNKAKKAASVEEQRTEQPIKKVKGKKLL